MELKDKIIVVTGAASGIGKAHVHALAAEGAKAVICVDRERARRRSDGQGDGRHRVDC